MDNTYVKHSRQVYNFLDLLGDLGGVAEIIILVLGVAILPISSHSFQMRIFQRLYLAKTKDPSIFKTGQPESYEFK